MAHANLERLMNNIRTHVPGAIDSNIKLELFNALNEFFKDSRCWLEDIEFNVQAGETEYELFAVNPGTIVSLMSLVDSAGVSVKGTMQIPGTVILASEPSATDTYTANVSLTVVDPVDRDDYPQMPTWLLPRYYDAIFEGTVAKLMAEPAKPYTNERMAVYHSRRFRASIATARSEARHQNLFDGQRWRFPAFARGNQR